MKKGFNYLLLLIAGATFLSSCTVTTDDEDPTVFCQKATLCIRNPSSTDVIPYSWGSSLMEDTLWPGECAIREVDSVRMGPNGTSFVEFFNTLSGTHAYDWTRCEQEYEATEGFVNLQKDCDNGIFNPESGEQNTDCGGWCKPCKPPVFSCSLPTEAIVFQNIPSQNESLYSTSFVSGLDHVDVRFDFPSNILFVSFQIPYLPKSGRKFITGSDNHEVQIRYTLGGFTDYYASPDQEVFLTKVGSDMWRLDFCDLALKIGTTDELINASLTFKETK